MKTSKLKMAFIAIITAFFALSPSLSSAQTAVAFPYRIENNLFGCSVNVSWVIYDRQTSPPNCTNICASGSSTIPAGSFVNIPGIYPCSAPCRISLTITGAGIAAPGVTVGYPATTPVNLGASANCVNTVGTADADAGRCVINP